ncbi:YcaC related amidohydrolase [Legionella sainthelensi]|uniref:YcaC related amidohydrolase n=1 Tax=Legionella sainthelensi TaxID=28087 RepID=A0A0W0YCC7_9GAMM|nr:hydrolase [Legionella sainthelensi]KTD54278.1 YcaC related amidohydrolase [Legionella sainthelensi]VEH30754.1 YcaC like amidohydrolase [Legionella sainthelensi]
MTSQPIRDPVNDILLTPKNSALLIIDYQPVQVNSIASMDQKKLVNNIVGVAKTGVAYNLPIILTTVNVSSGLNKPTIPELTQVLEGVKTYDRTSINSWEDTEFVNAVKGTARKKLIMTALWTEVCLTFPALDALNQGYEVYVVADAVGGTSVTAHELGLRRIQQAGGVLITLPQLLCELQRDWSRTATVPNFVEILGSSVGLSH